MKLQYMRLKNFIGIQLGLGVNEIEIPFYKGINKICMMLGANGSGKSTILDNAVPQPYVTGNDRAKIIIAGEDGEKELWYKRGNLTYKILITYKWNKSTESHSTKGFITRINETQGVEEELNPNGNITSFKDIVDMEFMLDPAFMRLCKLSQEAVNISRMKTTERKTLMSSLLEEASAYIAYGKKVDGKCRFLNTTIKNLASKINKIGNIDDINLNLDRVTKQVLEVQGDLEVYNNTVAVAQSKLESLPLDEYNRLKESIDGDSRALNGNKVEKQKILNKSYSSSQLEKYKESIEKCDSMALEKLKLTAEVKRTQKSNQEQELKDKLNSTRAKFETTATELQVNSKQKESIHRLELPDDIKKSISIYEDQLKDIDAKLAGVDVVYESDKLIKVQDLVQEINLRIDRNLNIAPELLDALLINFEKGTCISLKKQFDSKYEMNVGMEYNLIHKKIPAVQEKLFNLKAQRSLKAKLEERPSNCKIDTCPFIIDALRVPIDLEDQINKYELELKNLSKKYEDAKKAQDVYMDASKICLEFQDIYGMMKDNRELLEEAPDNWNFTVRAFINRIKNHSIFNDPAIDLNSHLIIASLNERYREIVDDILPRLKKDLELSQHTEFLLQSYINKIESCTRLLEEYENDMNSIQSTISTLDTEINDLSLFIDELNHLIYCQTNIEDCEKKLTNLRKEEEKFKELIDQHNKIAKEYEEAARMVSVYQNKLENLNDEKEKYTYDAKLYNEYTNERTKLEQSYIIHEKIRYALSSKTGIPLIFLDMYLNKTRIYANGILEELFGDEYRLCSFEINATEFRIPCEVRGELVSDISLMSSGERAIISLVLSLTLMYQASSVGSYDVITLDEMDAVLDRNNRNRFVDALEKLMEIFNIEQILAVSHSDGFESYPVDLVLLRDYTLENSNNKTIIYKFK